MREITLHDTQRGVVAPIVTRDPRRVGIYACGPTVYGRIHVGNARPFVVFSLLKRLLVHEGYEVALVANVTDINDKIYAAAHAQGIGSAELAREMTARYVEDTDALDLGRPDHEPLASETIEPIVSLISDLIDAGHAYAVEGDVYFAVRSYPGYGAVSHRRIDDELDQGEGAEEAGRKRDPLDFALWKGHRPEEDTSWEAPWGRGRPGWHIECSAMAESLLGVDFEIHGGGSDLLFPHHENEAAQTEAARGLPLARMWVHNGMVRLDREKMAKSAGNTFLLHRAIEVHGRDALLMYLCGGHYRQPIEFDDTRLEEAARRVARIREAARRLVPGSSPAWSSPLRERYFDALARDFSTPAALAVAAEWVTEANRSSEPVGDGDLREMLDVLGLANLLERGGAAAGAEVEELVAERERARAARDFAAADALRGQLRELGWEVRDGAAGPELVRVS
jgi:cysteinyl-tRNA synthetase